MSTYTNIFLTEIELRTLWQVEADDGDYPANCVVCNRSVSDAGVLRGTADQRESVSDSVSKSRISTTEQFTSIPAVVQRYLLQRIETTHWLVVSVHAQCFFGKLLQLTKALGNNV